MKVKVKILIANTDCDSILIEREFEVDLLRGFFLIEIGGAFLLLLSPFFGIKAFFKISTFYHAIFLKSKATFFKVKIKGFPLALFKIKIPLSLFISFDWPP